MSPNISSVMVAEVNRGDNEGRTALYSAAFTLVTLMSPNI